MIRVSVTVDLSPLTLIRERAQKMPGLLNTVSKRRVRSLRTRMKARFRIEPGPVKYPIKWKTRKQQRAFFATNGFGQGIPTRRTGAYSEAFDVVLDSTDSGGILRVTNDNPAAQFIGGIHQQPFHAITGWELIDDVVAEFTEIAFNEFREDFWTLADPFAGVPR